MIKNQIYICDLQIQYFVKNVKFFYNVGENRF